MRRTRVAYTSGMPPFQGWIRTLLITVVVLYVVELIARNSGVPLANFEWRPFGTGFAPHQLITHWFLMGRNTMGLIFSGLVLYFFAVPIRGMYSDRQLLQALGAGMGLAIVLGLGVDIAGALRLHDSALGWTPLATGLVVLFGLGAPQQEIRLFFAIPITAIWFVWFALVLAVFGALVTRNLASWEQLGVVLGILGWHRFVGPGRRRRELMNQANEIQDELQRFIVYEGGRSNRPDDDDLVH
jgi:hypothetical protein